MTTIQNWQAPIAEMYLEKQNLAAVDPENIFPFFLPNVAAAEETIAATEEKLGFTLDQDHKSFLRAADGWQCFYQNVTLFGTTDLTEGPLLDSAQEAFDSMPELLDSLNFTPEQVLPIAASQEQADVFVMIIKDGHVEPTVHWLAEGEVIDTYETFGEYFMSMIAYTKRRIEKM